MTTAIRNLWPTTFGTPGIVPPVTILRQQASNLGQITKNLVEGEVKTDSPGVSGRFRHNLYLVAPALDFYRHPLCSVEHDINLYPALVKVIGAERDSEVEPPSTGSTGRFSPAPESVRADTAEAFMDVLRDIFSRQSTRRVIESMIAQSIAMTPSAAASA